MRSADAQAVLDAIPDGWAKLGGQWFEVEFVGNVRGQPAWAVAKDA